MAFNMKKVCNPKWCGQIELSNEVFQIFKIPGLNLYPMAHVARITTGVNLIPGRFKNPMKTYDILHFRVDPSFPVFSFFL